MCLPDAEAKTYARFTQLFYAWMFKGLLRSPRTHTLVIVDDLAASMTGLGENNKSVNKSQGLFGQDRRILADQMEFLRQHVSLVSRMREAS